VTVAVELSVVLPRGTFPIRIVWSGFSLTAVPPDPVVCEEVLGEL